MCEQIGLNSLLSKEQMSNNAGQVETTTMYYVSLPVVEAHSGHPTCGGMAGMAQRMNEKVAAKVAEIVADGITELKQVRTFKFIHIHQLQCVQSMYPHQVCSLFRHHVTNDLCKDSPPDPHDRAYFPVDTDLKNHIYG